MITRVGLIAWMGDALNARSFLVEYCKQKNIPHSRIRIYTEKYWWMFEGMGFTRGFRRTEFRGLIGYRNFGNYDMPKHVDMDKCDQCIAENAGINYNFDVRTPLPDYGLCRIHLPERFVTFNTGVGRLSSRAGNPAYIATKQWQVTYWAKLISLLKIPCVQIGEGPTCHLTGNAAMNLVNRLTITESATVMRKALFHIDTEGGLSILNQHLGKNTVVLFGPCAIENQGRSFNLNLRAGTCTPCYEWGTHKYGLAVRRDLLACKAHCMTDLTPEYVADQIYKSGWL